MRTSPRSGREASSVSAGRFIRISPFAGTSMVWLNRHSFGVNAPSDLANKNAATRKPAVNPFDQRIFDWNFIRSAFRKERESAGKATVACCDRGQDFAVAQGAARQRRGKSPRYHRCKDTN